MYRIGISALLVLLLGLIAASGWALYTHLADDLNDTASSSASRQAEQNNVEKRSGKAPETKSQDTTKSKLDDAPAKAETAAQQKSNSSIDVALIDPTGTSVIAGSAEPKSKVVVSADGVEVATVESDANGEWVVTTDHKFKTDAPEIDVKSVAPDTKTAQASTEKQAKQPDPADVKPDGRSSPSAKTADKRPPTKVAERLTQAFEKIVEDARQEKEQSQKTTPSASEEKVATAAPQPQTPKVVPAPTTTTVQPPSAQEAEPDPQPLPAEQKFAKATAAAPTPEPVTRPAPTEPEVATPRSPSSPSATRSDPPPPDQPPSASTQAAATIPIPIGFIYREANLTEQGQKAVLLLAEYLAIKELKSVVLTGHADERGSNQLNMDLSRARLDTVARELKEHGYTGDLELIAKGESEPYTAVNRSTLSKEELYALDRRVELKNVQ